MLKVITRVPRLAGVEIGKPLSISLLGLLLSQAVVMGQLHPFGTSFLAGVCIGKPEWKRFALLGVLAGTVFTVGGLTLLGYLASITILYSVFSCYRKENLHRLIVPALILGIHLLARGSIIFFTGGEAYLWVAIVFECIFVAILSMVVNSGIQAYEKIGRGFFLTAEERTSLGLIVLGVLVGIAGFSLWGCGLQSIVSRWLVLWGAFLGGPGGGAAVGVAVGLAPGIQGVVTLGPIAFYALAGLLGGIFCNFKKGGVVVGFALANLLMSFFFAEDVVIRQSLKETVIAVGLFFLLQIPFLQKTKTAEEQSGAAHARTEPVNHYYADRLEQIAGIFNELEKVFAGIRESRKEGDEMNTVFNKVTNEVCGGCSLKKLCWEQDFYKTYQAFLDVCSLLESEGSVREKDFGVEMKRRCVRLREIIVALNAQLEGVKVARIYEKQLEVCRGLVNRQLAGLAKIVGDFSAEIRKEMKADQDTEEYVRYKMAEKGFDFAAVRVLELPQGEKEIRLIQKPCAQENLCSAMIAPNISQILDRTYVLKTRYCSEQAEIDIAASDGAGCGNYGCCSFSLVPSRTMQVVVGQAQCPKEGFHVSGDLCSAIMLPNHQFALLMCDGMGVGDTAYAESCTAVKMLEKLLLAGFSPQLALRTVNTALLLKSTGEKFVALDLAVLNQISGQCDFIKIGGVPTLIYSSGGGLKIVRSSSLPAGILEEVQPQIFRHMLKPHTGIIMMSDGVWDCLEQVEGPEGWLEGLLAQVDYSDPQTLADSILFIAKKAAGNQAPDDMCVLVACLKQKEIE